MGRGDTLTNPRVFSLHYSTRCTRSGNYKTTYVCHVHEEKEADPSLVTCQSYVRVPKKVFGRITADNPPEIDADLLCGL